MRFFCTMVLFGLCLMPLWAGEPNPNHAKLLSLMDKEWALMLDRDPLMASTAGVKTADGLWPDISLAAQSRFNQRNEQLLAELLTLDLAQLDAEDQLNARILRFKLEDEISEYQFQWYLVPINQRSGIQSVDSVARQLSYTITMDYVSWLERLDNFPIYADQHIELMRKGISEKMMLPRLIMSRITDQIKAQIVSDPTQSGFYYPFSQMPATFPEGDKLKARAQELIRTKVMVAYQKFLDFFEKEYLPASLEKVGIGQLPRGKELYAHFTASFTTTKMTPEEIHETGMQEVTRIRAEMMEIIKQVGFKGDFEAFLNFLRTDPQFYYKTPEELMIAYQVLAKRIDPTLVKVFDKLPRMPYGVEAIPASIAPDTTTAYYQQPNPDGTLAGTYFVNLYKPETRPKYEMEALTMHESVPGHHLQIALAQELGELPAFRRYYSYNAFAEGWALYAESLGGELGFYQDPYSKFGQLTYEMWRAVRLVVDTGIHQMGWDRQKAIDFFKANAAKTELDIINEVDRYIVWPGQALGYKIGELKIKELRKRAERKLGPKFNLRYFHNVVLGSGSIPLTILEENVDQWIAAGGPR